MTTTAGTKAYDGLIPEGRLDELVRAWLAEDVPSFDIGGAVVGTKQETATLLCKSPGVLAGRPFFDAVFRHLGCKVTWEREEGEMLAPSPGERIQVATVQGEARKILLGERVALNTLARASGIATRSRKMISLKEEKGWKGVVAGTRKTTPGFRLVEKHAMLVGGADCHRMDLSSMVMLKDNHIWSQGSIPAAVSKARDMAGFSVKIEVECGTEEEAREAIAAGADVVMLDNFSPDDLGCAAARIKDDHPHIIVEGSGGITVESIQSYMHPSVDVLSTSWIHQGTPHVDFSLKINH
ncbi:nicotinate-nucleotide pyrophosphorylase [Salpingoeca rosetta]|uniref:Nicotinate-nucleotide pyrophosphorylase [carboxylating] n=1 Tax=Salpingoeca rosetta (strain ATCC 50818 / BSB-021) TaxID=946362 RepID=F2TX82_SALR5|nr:nicotinate-nucleotide pyrophosphorylase [Salpingoeca rosetta]EGD75991.1 nicotinate-nucleotide pyrophosphorylase [Salpingoeca rosetta]|eukprot:XP_004998166.1 nicotinate-nucleotide pyrophosphorylase [Salpingoeca rosetta]